MEGSYDLVVVGGGINGAGIARDAAGRGYSVLLCEQGDLGQFTSSASSKLIHGGLRYLEHREFGLVRKALREREVLLRSAPHLIRPLRFVMPHDATLRNAWVIRSGLFLYDHLAPRGRLPASEVLDLRRHAAGEPLKPEWRRGFAYSDARTDDSRLVLAVARDAAERGAVIRPRTRFLQAARNERHWEIKLANAAGRTESLRARALVNAAGPWLDGVGRTIGSTAGDRPLRLVKGSHIVVPRLFDHGCAYLFQNPDKRILFAIPYEGRFTLLGTTEVDYTGDPARAAIDQDEADYLCTMAGRYFKRPVSQGDVVWTYSGVRPLLDDESREASAVTRDYSLNVDSAEAPVLSVLGGKLTIFRRLAEEAVARLQPLLGGRGPTWTADAKLPGGDFAQGDLPAFAAELARRHPWLPASLALRYAGSYGTRAQRIIDGALRLDGLGREIVPGLREAEARYLVREEWAETAEDILWRRTKLGLHLPYGAAARLEEWLRAEPRRAAG